MFVFLFSPNFFDLNASELSDAQKDRAILEAELIKLEKEIAQKQKELDNQKGQSASLSRDINILTTKISQAKLDIQAKNLTIQKLGGEISKKSATIQELTQKIETEKETLAQLIRKNREIDDMPLIALVLSSNSISDIYGDVENFTSIKKAIQGSVNEIKSVRGVTEQEKKNLEEKRNKETDVKMALENTKKQVEQNQVEQKKLLSISKNKEVEYQQVIKDRQAQIAKIRAELIKFEGSGIAAKPISFGEAYDYALEASKKTGVRVAFILAIMQQETSFGHNFGGCYLRDENTGDGIYIKSGNPSKRNMVPGNFPSFQRITQSLGLDWKNTPISCALVKTDGTLYGYGGAMGYTQFIPNTWMLVEARVRDYLKVSTANPWNPRHAVMATAIFLKDKGASSQSYTAERTAACGYYGACSSYADSVMKKASAIQQTINQLESLSL